MRFTWLTSCLFTVTTMFLIVPDMVHDLKWLKYFWIIGKRGRKGAFALSQIEAIIYYRALVTPTLVAYFLGHLYVLQWQIMTMCCLDYDEQSSHTSVIRAHYVFLLETLDVKFSGFIEQLYLDDVISAVERDNITAEKTSFRANEKLLSALSHKSSEQFQLFLDALSNCGQQHVRNVITGPRGNLWYYDVIDLQHFPPDSERNVYSTAKQMAKSRPE